MGNSNKHYLKFMLFFLVLLSLNSCKSVKKGVGDAEVYLYKSQAKYMDANYFVEPYRHVGKSKTLGDIFKLDESDNVDLVTFKFISDEELEITYSDGLRSYKKIVEGKMKNGGFRYVNKTLPLGIPLVLFSFQRQIHYIALGNDDNIIITEYDYTISHFFFTKPTEERTENKYYFDRQLKL